MVQGRRQRGSDVCAVVSFELREMPFEERAVAGRAFAKQRRSARETEQSHRHRAGQALQLFEQALLGRLQLHFCVYPPDPPRRG